MSDPSSEELSTNKKNRLPYLLPDGLWSLYIDKGQMGQVIHTQILNAWIAMPLEVS